MKILYRIVGLLLVVGLLGVAWCRYTGCLNPSEIEMETMTLRDLEGNIVSLDAYKGKPIFFNIWASWCGDCLKEMPSIENAKKELADTDYVFLFVSDEDYSRIKRFISRKKYDFTYLKMDEKLKDIGITFIPQSYIIDRNGKIVYESTGGKAWDTQESIELLRSFAM